MNLRILKKLSKRAAPLLVALGNKDQQFPADRWDGHTSSTGHERKHWKRGNSRSRIDFHGYVYWQARNGLGHSYMRQPNRPWKGTIMLGWTVGHETPEWEEDDAGTLLVREVEGHFTEMIEVEADEDDPDWFGPDHMPRLTRSFPNPSAILRAVPDVFAARLKEQAERSVRRSIARICEETTHA